MIVILLKRVSAWRLVLLSVECFFLPAFLLLASWAAVLLHLVSKLPHSIPRSSLYTIPCPIIGLMLYFIRQTLFHFQRCLSATHGCSLYSTNNHFLLAIIMNESMHLFSGLLNRINLFSSHSSQNKPQFNILHLLLIIKNIQYENTSRTFRNGNSTIDCSL